MAGVFVKNLYMVVCMARRRGGQSGNVNAVKHGFPKVPAFSGPGGCRPVHLARSMLGVRWSAL